MPQLTGQTRRRTKSPRRANKDGELVVAGVPAASIAGNMVVTPDMVPPNPASYDEEAKFFNALADHAEDTQKQWQGSNNTRTQSAQSPGFDAGHEVNRLTAVDFGRLADVYRDAANYYSSVADVYRTAHRAQQSAINHANDELRQAKTPTEQPAIIARWHTHARSLTNSAVAEAEQKSTRFRTSAGSNITALDSLTKGTAPQAPTLPRSGGNGIAVPAGKPHTDLSQEGEPGEPTPGDGSGTDAPGAATSAGRASGKGPYQRGQREGTDGLPNGAPDQSALLSGPYPDAGQSPLSGNPLQSLAGFPGSLSSGGGGLGSLSSGSGLGSLGSGGGLSGLTSGGFPGAQTAGLGGLPSSTSAATAAPQAATSAGAFSQGLSAGSNAGSALSSLPPATGTGASTATSSQAAAAAPAAGLADSAAPSAGLGAPGAAPGGASAGSGAATSAGSAGVSGAPGAMMVPPPGMGAPAAPVAAGSAGGSGGAGAPVVPAGNAGSSSSAVGSAGAGSLAAGSNGAMLVPASVVAGTNAGPGQRQRMDSPELASAKALALKLRRDCDGAKYPCIEWAVGIFRSEVGGATECVVTSNEGFAYIPWGVFLPRSARLLSADKLADNRFRDQWFGCKDPAQVMEAYAKQRAERGSRMVALAITSDSPESRVPGVEYGICPPRNLNESCSEPVLEDMHAHRLEILYPDLYARLQRITSTAEETRAFANQVCVGLAMQMIDAVQMAAGVDSPPELRHMWDALGTGDPISDDEWQQYLIASIVFNVNLSASRLPLDAGVAERERYRAQWVAARTMEFLRGWQRTPPDVADMIYAAAVAYPGDFAVKFEPLLRAPEAALAK